MLEITSRGVCVRLLWLSLILAALSVPAWAGDVIEEIAVKVNSDVITKSELERARAELRQELLRQYQGNTLDFQAAYAQKEKDLLKDLIDLQLLIQRGKDLNVNVDSELVKRLDAIRKDMGLNTLDDLEKATNAQGVSFEDLKNNIKNDLIRQRVIGQEVGSHLKIGADRIHKFYEANKEKFNRQEEVRIREILISTDGKEGADLQAAEKKAKEVLDKVKKGGKFPELAQQYSDGNTAKTQGGDLGFFRRGQMASELETVAFGLKKGETSDLIRTKYGFEIIKVEEKHQAGIQPEADVENEIQEALYWEDLQPAMKDYLAKLRLQAYIDVKPGYVDTGAVANQNYARLVPQDMSEDELVAPKSKGGRRSFLPPFRKKK